MKVEDRYKAAVTATGIVCLTALEISGRFGFRFRVISVEMVFRDDAADGVRYYWKLSGNRSVSTTGVSEGRNIFSPLAPIAYFVGTGIIKKVPCYVEASESENYIKLHTNNTNAWASTVNGSITIEEV